MTIYPSPRTPPSPPTAEAAVPLVLILAPLIRKLGNFCRISLANTRVLVEEEGKGLASGRQRRSSDHLRHC